MTASSSYREYLPGPALRASVACYWTLEAGAGPQRILPDGCMDVLFDVSGSAEPTVVGTMTTAIVSSRPTCASLLGVRFRPGEGVFFLGRIPARQLRDAAVPLDEIWAQARDLGEQVALLPDTAARRSQLDEVLGIRLAWHEPDERLRKALQTIDAAHGAVRVAMLARSLGLGERQLERLFDEYVGVGPKVLARIARVQTLLRRLGPGTDWADLAADLGWSDQAHLTRDLRDIAGVTPTELARALRMSDSFNQAHGPLPMLVP